eukprot:scaffold203098_cov35-Tisochrysis_lutea.AAC.1
MALSRRSKKMIIAPGHACTLAQNRANCANGAAWLIVSAGSALLFAGVAEPTLEFICAPAAEMPRAMLAFTHTSQSWKSTS